MWTVITCIRDEHDIRFVLGAAFVCVVAAFTALQFHRRTLQADGRVRLAWTALSAIVGGSGVWATHFVAMLAYHPHLPIRYDGVLTAVSLAVVILGMGIGFAFAAGGASLLRKGVAGAFIGLSVAGMHFLGVSAIRSSFELEWDNVYVAAAVLIAMSGAAGALILQARTAGWRRLLLPALALVVSIVGLHFTAMAALTVIPDLTQPAVREVIDRHTLAAATGGVAVLIMGLAFLLTLVEAQSRKRNFRSLDVAFQGVPSGLAMFGADGRLQLWNGAYDRLLSVYQIELRRGMTRTELLGQAAQSGAAKVTDDEGLAGWVNRVEAERMTSGAQEWRTPEGVWIRAELSLLENGGTISVLTDVTTLKEAAEAMAEARDRAEAASRAKSDFLTNMSHEIRTPLNGVLGMAQVMEGGELADAQRERLRVIRESGTALLAILNDVLDLSKVQAGKLELDETDTDLVGLAQQVGAAFEGAAASRDLTLRVDADPSAAGLWRADGLRLRQILSNLVGNALKFTHEGGVTLSLTASEEGVVFTVRDTGIGLDAETLPRLFDKFSQADASTTRQYGGTGLGLAICKELAELMGGMIAVSSAKGEGSSFTVVLPLRQTSHAVRVAAVPVQHAEMVQRLRILAAEDNATNQLVLRSLLEPIDCDLVVANNGREAVERYEVQEFDVILMDVQMPVMNGIEATAAIRAGERVGGRVRTPIIALSANVMTHQIAEYMAAGMDGWCAKPIELDKLYAALDAALEAPAGVGGTLEVQAA